MRTQSADTDLQAESVQVELLRRATVARRVSLVVSLSRTVMELAARAIRRQNPNLSDHEILMRFVAIHYGPELAQGLRRDLAGRRT
jgi:hypothetical protein